MGSMFFILGRYMVLQVWDGVMVGDQFYGVIVY